MTSDQERLAGYIETWTHAVDDVVRLLLDLTEEDWSRPTDLAGWDVRAVAAHLAHLESEISGVEQERVDVPELEHLTAPSARYTEAGRIAREPMSNQEIVDELVTAVRARSAELRADPPTDGSARPPITPGGAPWDWETMLRNRPLDIWMHEQDIRRAVGRPGGMNNPAAAHTVRVLTMGIPFVVGKRVAPPSGTTVVLDVTGIHPVHLALEINEQGRAVPSTSKHEHPTVSLQMDVETFVLLAGGRRAPEELPVIVAGDHALGQRILAVMGVTP
ncbi:MAG TPA: maleylpyruvate isomerase family mycothiol-dependent enzyme [Nocardioidaceae bacterium]|nr:maleylpyruvate isomerase family mycothiol-dependent enzyme [Nocardioidaceae bacterium]